MSKSAKDLAWDRERAKYANKIRKLRFELQDRDAQIAILEAESIKLKDWVERLLKYTGLSEEDMKTLIEREMNSAESFSYLHDLLKVSTMFGGRYRWKTR